MRSRFLLQRENTLQNGARIKPLKNKSTANKNTKYARKPFLMFWIQLVMSRKLERDIVSKTKHDNE
jgi:hypothetical protein